MTSAAPAARSIDTHPTRIGVVSFINTLPLIDGLDACVNLSLHQSVPSQLIDRLTSGEVDIALCSSIDYQRPSAAEELIVLPVGLLGCCGPTMTVRLYATLPIADIETIHTDTDSHTSIILLQILLRELHHITPQIIPYDAREHVAANKPLDHPDAMLLIGDKVVTDSPPAVRYPHQLDLGEAWHELTGLPFVFAMWMARASTDHDRLRAAAHILDRQRRHNQERLDRMIHTRAVPRQWPADLAAEYLHERLNFAWTEQHQRGVEQFFAKAAEHQLIDSVRPLRTLPM